MVPNSGIKKVVIEILVTFIRSKMWKYTKDTSAVPIIDSANNAPMALTDGIGRLNGCSISSEKGSR